jgi:tRNA(fMet)-specific endonuclease VapC
MLILDTGHLVEYQKGTSPAAQQLKQRLDEAGESFGTTIITFEEMMRGWLAAIKRANDPSRQVAAYSKLQLLVRSFAAWDILEWTTATAAEFSTLRKAKVRVGTMDLKIASIALANDATVLSRNIGDLEKVPRLRVDDWLS